MHGPGGGMAMHGMQDPALMVRHISRWLELDDSRTQELTNLVMAARPQMIALREKARENRSAIAGLDTDARDYPDRLQGLAAKNGEIATEMTVLMGQLRADIHSRLTAEERQKLADRTQGMQQHGAKRFSKGCPEQHDEEPR